MIAAATPQPKLQQAIADAKAAGWSRWVRNEADERALLAGYTFDVSRDKRGRPVEFDRGEWVRPSGRKVDPGQVAHVGGADRVIRFAWKFCRLTDDKWSGQPFIHQVWQRERLTGPVFGWKRPDGRRRFTRVFCTVAKKNGKSGYGSMVANYMLAGDGQAGPCIATVACDRSQAKIIFDEAANMVRPTLVAAGILQVIPSRNRLIYPARHGALFALSADVKTKEGLKLSGLLDDEMHAQPNANLYDALKGAMIGKSQPIWWMFTTAGEDPNSIWAEELALARDIDKGTAVDLSYLPVLYEADKEDDLDSEGTWRKANPSLDYTQTVEQFRLDLEEARKTPRRLAKFKRYRLNFMAESVDAMFDLAKWNACAGRLPEPGDEPTWQGLDLADNDDIAALVQIWWNDSRLCIRPTFWCPEGTIKTQQAAGNTSYYNWVQDGWLRTMPEGYIDQDIIKAEIWAQQDASRVACLGFDPNQCTKLAGELMAQNVTVRKVTPFVSQMGPPTAEFERLHLAERIIHDGNPVMEWMIGNAVAFENNNGQFMPSKKKSSRKIDGVSALVIALACALQPAEDAGIVTQGFITA